ncbi:MAG: CRISPR-associated endonuclease Cas1 [Porticoccaceae bacterium]
MDTLFVDRKGTRLDTEAGRLIIRPPETKATTLPLSQIRYIVLSSRVELSTTLMLALSREGITLIITHPTRHDDHLVCGGPSHGNVTRKVRQFALFIDAQRRLDVARRIVSAKLLSQYRALARHRRRRPDLRRAMTRAMLQISERWQALPTVQHFNAVRGIEGAAAAAYFSALGHLFAPSLNFTQRKRRPPPDPVNALLSLTYTLIHGEAVRALLASGLDPTIGALHDPHYNRDSLACDLVELLRASAESWVVDLFRQQHLQSHHFQQPQTGACLLGKEGRALFYPLYQQASLAWRNRLRQVAAQWARELSPDGSTLDVLADVPPQPAD